VPRGGRRPGLTRRATGAGASVAPGPGQPPGRPRRPGLTTRAAVLALVICGIVLGLAYPFRTHLAQQAELERLVAEQEERSARVAALETDLARWDDRAHVEAEARRRLGYLHPGETLYTVLDPTAPPQVEERVATPGVPPLREQAPWWSQLWHSAQGSDAAPVTPAAPTR
jgi:cell division protein FtsB